MVRRVFTGTMAYGIPAATLASSAPKKEQGGTVREMGYYRKGVNRHALYMYPPNLTSRPGFQLYIHEAYLKYYVKDAAQIILNSKIPTGPILAIMGRNPETCAHLWKTAAEVMDVHVIPPEYQEQGEFVTMVTDVVADWNIDTIWQCCATSSFKYHVIAPIIQRNAGKEIVFAASIACQDRDVLDDQLYTNF